jgi:hypothetical protein
MLVVVIAPTHQGTGVVYFAILDTFSKSVSHDMLQSVST